MRLQKCNNRVDKRLKDGLFAMKRPKGLTKIVGNGKDIDEDNII